MATLIPIEGEIVLTDIPKTSDALDLLLASSATDKVSPAWLHAPSGEAFVVNGRETRENARATRFAQARNLEFSYLPLRGPVVLFSEVEKLAFDLHLTAERNAAPRATQIVNSLANALQSGAITMIGGASGSGKTSTMLAALPAGALPPVVVKGNTFPVKDQLKALGGKWDPVERAWTVPADKAAEAQALVAQNARPASQGIRPNAKPGKCVACGCRVDVGAGVINYVANSSGGGKWVVNCAPADQTSCDLRRQSLRKGSTVKSVKQYAAEVARLGIDKLVRTSVQIPSTGSGPNGWTKIAETLDYPETRLYEGAASTGETIYCEHRIYPDEDRIYYYGPVSVAEAAWEARARIDGIDGDAAREWLLKYTNCEGAEFYGYVARTRPEV